MKRRVTTIFTWVFLLLGVAALAIGSAAQPSEACGTSCCGGKAKASIPDCKEEAGESCECSCTCSGAACLCIDPDQDGPGGGEPR